VDKTERRFVEFTDNLSFEALPDAAVTAAKVRFIDSIGVALAAVNAPTVQAARRLAPIIRKGSGDGSMPRARLLGTSRHSTLEQATLVNAAMVRYLDMSDAYVRASTAHPSDNIPALLAVAESCKCSGRDLIAAIAVAYEIHLRICDVVPFFGAGWDQSFASAPAAALGCAKLLRLSPAAMRDALAIAVTANLSTRQTRAGNLSMWKGLAGPLAARQAVFATQIAAQGVTGPENSIDGDFGLWRAAMRKPYSVRLPRSFAGHTFAVQESNIKLFPVRDAVQIPVLAALELRRQCKQQAIRSLRVETYRHAFAVQSQDRGFWQPKSRESADHSLPACIAIALLDGEVTPAAFEAKRYLDADVRGLVKRTTLAFDARFDKAAPATRNVRLTAQLNNGNSVVVVRKQTAADVVAGFDAATIEEKFHQLTATLMSAKRRQDLLDSLWRLDEIDDVAGVVGMMKCAGIQD
jgi:2-methylcitrate dehydratase